MARNRILLIFRLIISAIDVVASKSQYETLLEYIKEITASSPHRSLVLVYNNVTAFEELSASFYGADTAVYNVYLQELKKFNGKYHTEYDIKMTFEESKLYFIVINVLEDFYADLALIRKIYLWRDRDRIVIFVISGKYNKSSLKKIFRFCYSYYIVNVVFAFINPRIAFFTYNPFTNDFYLQLYDPRRLFPDKFQDLNGYQLRISMFPSVINVFEDNTYQGADGFMSRAIAKHINASYKYILPKVNDLAPILNQYDDVAERIVDVGFNTRYIKFNFKNLIEKTYPHDRDDLTCFLPKLGVKKVPELTSLLPESAWFLTLGVSLLFFMYVTAASLMRKHRVDAVAVIMTILLLLIGKVVKETKISNFRLVLIFYLLFSFFLNTLFICRLSSIFTAPEYYQEIDTIEEMANTKYQILTIDRFQDLLNASLTGETRDKILRRLKLIKEEEYLGEMSKCEGVIFICKDHLAMYAQINEQNYPNGVQFYRVMKERILPALSCYIVSYGSPFQARLDTLVRRILEAGLYDYWKTKTWEKLGMGKDLRFNQNKNYAEVGVSLQNFWIGIQVLLTGLGLAFFVFLLELASKLVIKFSFFYIYYITFLLKPGKAY